MRYWYLVITTLFLVGCQDIKQPEKPIDLIEKDKMVEILTETYLANAARSINNKKIIAEGIKIDSMIYRKFGIDSTQFAKSNAYYAADVNQYIEIFTSVESNLKKLEADLEEQKFPAVSNKENDSIK